MKVKETVARAIAAAYLNDDDPSRWDRLMPYEQERFFRAADAAMVAYLAWIGNHKV